MSDDLTGRNNKTGVQNNGLATHYGSLAPRYYSLALYYAKRRNLSSAVIYSRRSLMLDPDIEKARRLLGLCLFELGAFDGAAAAYMGSAGQQTEQAAEQIEQTAEQTEQAAEQTEQAALLRTVAEERMQLLGVLARVGELAARKKWRKAEALLRACKRQSVRVLLIRGCLKASAKHYKAAAKLFAAALNMDSGNRAAMAYLRDCCVSPRF